MRNNIFFNEATPTGVGIASAFARGIATGTNYNVLSDRNIYYSGAAATSSQLIYYDGTNSSADLAAFNTLINTVADDNSYEENVIFLSTTGSDADYLKFDNTSPSAAESGGSNIGGVTDDYVGTTRQGNGGYAGTGSAPDVGAWELEGTALGGCSGAPASSNAVTSTATPCTGANFTLSLDVAYGLGYSYQWESATASAAGPYTSIGGATNATLLTSAFSNTYYRCIITCISSTQSVTSTEIAVTVATLNGTYTINNTLPTGSGNYNTFADAVTDLGCKGVSGPVTFNVSAGQTFIETVNLDLTFTGTSTNTITFQKSGVGANPKIQRVGTSGTTDYILKLSAVDYYTFDGIDFEQTGTSATDWVEYGVWLTNISTTNGAQNNTIKNGVITLPNSSTSSKGVVINSTNTASSAAGAQSNNIFENMTIASSFIGYNITGSSSTILDNGNEIRQAGAGVSLINNLGDGIAAASMYGVFATYQTNFKVTGTTISNMNNGGTSLMYGVTCQTSALNSAEISGNTINGFTGSGTMYGIYFSSMSTGSIFNNTISNFVDNTAAASGVKGIYSTATGAVVSIYNNRVYNIQSNGLTTTSVAGIDIGTGVYTVYNNMISDLRAPSSTNTTGGTRGIWISGGTASTIHKIYYNSIYLNDFGLATAYTSAGISNSSVTANIDLRNNIVINKSDISSAGTRVAAFWKTAATDNVENTSNNNLWYAGTPGANNLIYYNGTTGYQTIPTYQAATEITPGETNAKTEDVVFQPFVSGIIRPDIATPSFTESGALPIVGFASDFENDTRNVTTPDMGADEFNGVILPNMTYVSSQAVQLTGNACAVAQNLGILRFELVTTNLLNPLTLTSMNINANGTSDINDIASYRVYYTGTSSTFNTSNPIIAAATGLTASPDVTITPSSTVTLSAGTNYFWLVYNMNSTVVGANVDAEITEVTLSSGSFTPSVTAPASALPVFSAPTVTLSPSTGLICNPGGTAVTLTAGGASTYAYSPTTGLTPSSGSPVSAIPFSSTIYTVTGTDVNGCTNTATSNISVALTPQNLVANASPSIICTGGSSSLSVTDGINSTFNVGTATTTISGNNGNPYRSGNGTGNQIKTQMLYTAAELSAAGLFAGPITELGFTTTTTTGTLSNFEIRIGASSASVLTTTFESSPALVFTEATFTPVAGINMHTFNAGTFIWDGSSNILVQTCQTNSILGTSTVSAYTPGVTSNVSMQTSMTSCSSTTGTTVATKPIIRFTQFLASSNYTWQPGSLSGTPQTVSPSSNTIYTVTASNSGCTTTSTVSVNIAGAIVCSPITSSNGTSVCLGNNTTLTASATIGGLPYTYDWTADASLSATNIANPVATPTVTTTYTCTVTDACGTTCSTTITINVNSLPTVTLSPSTGLICNPGGTAVTLTASGVSTYAWTPSTGLSATTGASVSANPSSSTTYTVTGTDGNGCSATSVATITLASAVPALTASSTPSSLCAGQTGNIDVSVAPPPPPATYCTAAATTGCGAGDEFINNVTFGTINNTTVCGGTTYSDFTAISTNVVAGTPGTLTVGCPNYFSGDQCKVWIDLNQNGLFTDAGEEFIGTGTTTFSVPITVPVTALNGNTRMRVRLTYTTGMAPCGTSLYGETEDYTVNISGGVPVTPLTYTYLWTDPTSSTSASTSVTPASTTAYTVTVTDGNGCTATSTTSVTVNALPTVTASASSTTLCSGDNLTLTGGGSATSYAWSDGTNTPTDATPFVVTTGTSTYTVTGSDGTCSSTSTVSITVNAIPTVTASASQTTLCSGDNLTLTGGGATSYAWSDGTNTPTDATPFVVTSGTSTYTVTGTDGNSCSATSTVNIIVNSCTTVTLDLTAFIEGYYDVALAEMRTPLFTSGITLNANDCENLTVELHGPLSTVGTPIVLHTFTGVLQKNGTLTCTFPGTVVNNSYYIVISSPNTIKTWSANPYLFDPLALPYAYNFSTAATQAFGGNMIEVSTGRWAVFSGDIDQLNGADLNDFTSWQTDYDNFSSGYYPTDLDGDGSVGLSDFTIWQANFDAFASEVGP
jgi:hypothetical protein